MQRTLQNIEEKNYFAENGWPDVLEMYKDNELVMCAFGGLLHHLEEVKLASDVLSMNNFRNYEPNEHASTMVIDGQTLANLEILSNNRDHRRKGSLIEHLDRCLTSFGKRLFRKWICAPLRRIEDINARLDAIEDLHNVSEAKDEIRPLLKQIPDLERMLAKIHSEGRIEKDAVSFDSKADKKKIDLFLETLAGLKKINEIANKMSELHDQFQTKKMKTFVKIVPRDDELYYDVAFPQIEDLLEHFNNAFDHSIAREQGIICPNIGEDEEYDQVEAAITKLENEFQEYLKTVRQNLKCPNIEYKNLQGNLFQLEIPKNVKVPSDYIAMSKTTKVNRYYTPWISKNLPKYQELESKREDVLRRQMKKMFKKFDVYFKVWSRCIDYCAELDCLFSLSLTSFESHLTMTRPNFTNDGPVFDIKMMVHPCVTSPNPSTPIRPNDTLLGGLNHPSCVIVTGPNMGGKSTLLRQNCIAIIMAQIGCYVPAQQFTLSPVDRIFTRIGANDKIMAGESTFMVELNETSNIINNATRDSFVILDEMGRGTSTFDGLSIAYAVVQYLAEKIQCRTLFSTHYYNLTEQLKYHPLIAMYQMECFVNPADKNDITFLYKYSPGVCPKSYGMHVARMAGIDSKIVDRASQIAETFEQNLENQMKGTSLDSSNISVEQTQRFLTLHTLLNSQTDINSMKAHLRMLQSATLSSFCSYI
jgi:DNA mismatch repair protein MSH6